MGVTDHFSKGLIPLKYIIYEERKKGLTSRGLLLIIIFLTPFIVAGLTAKYLGIFSVIIGIIPLLILTVKHKTSWEVKTIGDLEINDSKLTIRTGNLNEKIAITEIKKIIFKNCINTRSGSAVTFTLNLILKSGEEYKLHVDRKADIEDRPKHFYSAPPSLDLILELLNEKFKVNVWYDRT
jgi:hypothetical protein